MDNKLITNKQLSYNILRLLGTDKIKILKRDTILEKDVIYLYNNKFYKCIKEGVISLPDREYFEEISLKNNTFNIRDLKKKLSGGN